MSDSVTLAKALVNSGVSIPDESLREEVAKIAERETKTEAKTEDKTDSKKDGK